MDQYAAALGFGSSAPPPVSDPYAAALGFAPRASAPKGSAKAGSGVLSPEDQARSDAYERDPSVAAELQREVARASPARRAILSDPNSNGTALVAAAPAQDAGAGRGTMPASAYVQPQEMVTGAAAIPGYQAPAPRPPDAPWWDKVRGAHEAALTTLSGATTGMLGGLAGGAKALVTGQDPGQGFQEGAQALTYSPRTASGQEQAGTVGDTMSYYGPSLIAIGPEIGALGEIVSRGAKPAVMGADRSFQGMQDAFAAKKAGAAMRVEPTAEAAPVNNPAKFSDAAPASQTGPLPANEQQRRAQVLASVGLDQARKSALTGNAKDAATEAQMAKVDSPSGNAMKAQLDNEKAALANHADELVKATGGSQGLDESTLFGRGNAIVAPLDALKDHFDAQTSALYSAANEKAGGTPTSLSGFGSTLGDASELTNSDRVHLQTAVNAYAKKIGMTVGEDGSLSGTALQAETLRKYLGEQWSPANAGFVGKLKGALDQDVMGSAGEDLYSQARQLWAQKKNTLDNPNGIAKVMDSSGPGGINRSVPVEKIPDAIAGMPVQQFGHVVDTLKNVPDEIQPQAQAALSEIKAHFANKVQAIGTSQQGQWNAKGVTKFLNNNSERMNQVFTPEEMAQFHNLNDAGNILAKDQSYPGAAVQQHNLVKAGVSGALTSGGAAIGGGLAGPPGAAVGSWLGSKAATKINDAASLRAAQRRLTPLKDVGK